MLEKRTTKMILYNTVKKKKKKLLPLPEKRNSKSFQRRQAGKCVEKKNGFPAARRKEKERQKRLRFTGKRARHHHAGLSGLDEKIDARSSIFHSEIKRKERRSLYPSLCEEKRREKTEKEGVGTPTMIKGDNKKRSKREIYPQRTIRGMGDHPLFFQRVKEGK